MRVIVSFMCACLLIVMTVGCTLITHPTKFISSGFGVNSLSDSAADGYLQAAQKLKQTVVKNSAADTDPKHFVDQKCFQIPVASGDEPTCRQQRNEAVATLLIASDEMCQDHLKGIYGKDAGFNIAAGSVAIISSGLGTILNGVAAKTALSGVSTIASGERALTNEVVYKTMIVPSVTKKIREARTQKIAAMIPGSFAKGMDEYSMLMSFRDVIDYHQTCSFMYGLEKALDEGTQPNLETKKAKLEQDKQNLELYLENRTHMLKSGGRETEIATDEGIVGAKTRVKAIEQQLLALQNATSLSTQMAMSADPIKISPDKLEFEDSLTAKTITYKNTGSQAVTVVRVTPPGANFLITADQCAGKTINSNKMCTITVQSACIAPPCGATITITDNTLTKQRTVQLSREP